MNGGVSAQEWTTDIVDLDAYLERVGFTDGLGSDVATLVALHRRHPAAIPFENLDVVLGRGVSVDLDRIQAKLVRDRRGGYCYEHGLLFAAVLSRLGFGVDRLLARVGGDLGRPNARTHMALIVTCADGRWLADVGFGSGLLEPIPLVADAPATQGDWRYRLVRPAPGIWALQQLEGAEWVGQYTFDEQPQHLSDVVVSNHFTSTWPTSPFVSRAVVVRKDEHEVRRLLDRELSTTRADGASHSRTLGDADLGPALHGLGLDLPADDLAALIARVAPGDPGATAS